MAEWNRSANSSGGHPGTSYFHGSGIRDDPEETRLPVQETDGHTEEDGLPSIQPANPADGHQPLNTLFLSAYQDRARGNQSFPNRTIPLSMMMMHPQNSYYAQSASGFSDYAMNFPPGGNLQQLPSGSNQIFLPVQDQNYAAHSLFMCLVCKSRQLTQQGQIHHELECPVRQCMQTLYSAPNQLPRGNVLKKTYSNVLFPR